MPVNVRIESKVAILEIDAPPVNAFSGEIRAGLAQALGQVCASSEVDAIVLCGARIFSAGADISEFSGDGIRLEPMLWDLFDLLEASPKPIVSAIDGLAFGGGLECILATDARIATPGAKFSLPEVKLGILPGAGGSQRLPRLIGPEAAIELMVRGNSIDASEALKLGIIDAIVDELIPEAIARARTIANSGMRPLPARSRTDRTQGFDHSFFIAQRRDAIAHAKGLAAPAAIVDCVEAACTLTPKEGARVERERLEELRTNPQHAALTYLFRAERTAAKIPGLTASPTLVTRIAVIGGGTMGAGIAVAFANANIDVRLSEIDAPALQRGLSIIERAYERAVSRGSMSPALAAAAHARISSTIGLESLNDVDLVIEAVPEKMALKKELFAALDRLTPAETILATNTSSLDIDEIASATSRPGKVIGMHFFAPANVMKLVEVIRGCRSDDATVATVMVLGKRLSKISVLAGNCDGFIGNRMLQYYTGSAEFMVESGIAPERIDAVAERFGLPMGPLALRDLSGLDVAVLIRNKRRARLPVGARMSQVVEALHDEGRLGMKNGKGFYRYEGRRRLPDPVAAAIIEQLAHKQGLVRLQLTDDEILDRLLLPLVNEGAKELLDGTALRESDIDVTWVNGYGFPRHEGGPMHWGRRTGLAQVRAMAEDLSRSYGPLWAPAANLDALASGS